jgi:hypothetical protein
MILHRHAMHGVLWHIVSIEPGACDETAEGGESGAVFCVVVVFQAGQPAGRDGRFEMGHLLRTDQDNVAVDSTRRHVVQCRVESLTPGLENSERLGDVA